MKSLSTVYTAYDTTLMTVEEWNFYFIPNYSKQFKQGKNLNQNNKRIYISRKNPQK